MRVITATCFILLFASSLPAAAQIQRYEAHYEKADWTVFSAARRCEAVQQIPRYGEARFVQAAGGVLTFELTARHAPPQVATVRLRTEAPPWRGGNDELAIGELALEPEQRLVQVEQGAALTLLLELEAGRMPVLEYPDWTRPSHRIEVAVSPIRFLGVIEEFRDCVARLPAPLPVARVEPEVVPEGIRTEGATDAGAAEDSAAADERRRRLKYRILSGGPNQEVRLLLPEEAGQAPTLVGPEPIAPPAATPATEANGPIILEPPRATDLPE